MLKGHKTAETMKMASYNKKYEQICKLWLDAMTKVMSRRFLTKIRSPEDFLLLAAIAENTLTIKLKKTDPP